MAAVNQSETAPVPGAVPTARCSYKKGVSAQHLGGSGLQTDRGEQALGVDQDY